MTVKQRTQFNFKFKVNVQVSISLEWCADSPKKMLAYIHDRVKIITKYIWGYVQFLKRNITQRINSFHNNIKNPLCRLLPYYEFSRLANELALIFIVIIFFDNVTAVLVDFLHIEISREALEVLLDIITIQVLKKIGIL